MIKLSSVKKEILGEVKTIAKIHLNKFANVGDFGTPSIGRIYPLLNPKGEIGFFFEIKLTSADLVDHGFMVISTSRDYPPVLIFSPRGLTHVEELRRRVGHWNFNPVFYTPFYFVAEDDKRNKLAEFGMQPISFGSKRSRKKSSHPSTTRNKSYRLFMAWFLKQHNIVSPKHKELIQKAWDRLKKKISSIFDSGDSPYIDTPDVPLNNYQIVTALHYEMIPSYIQIPSNTGVNDKDFPSGCVACAWMCLYGYHDNTYALDLLRGTHEENPSPHQEYPDKVMMALSKYLGTHAHEYNGTQGGEVYEEDVRKGYDFIAHYLLHSYTNSCFTREDEMAAFQVVYDFLCRFCVPSVIAIENHVLIAYEVWANLNDYSEEHYLKVYDGGGNYDQYIPFEELKGAWTLQQIDTATHVRLERLDWHSQDVPAIADIGDKILIAFRTGIGKIQIGYSCNGKDFVKMKILEAEGTSAPALVSDNKNSVYIAWFNSMAPRNKSRLNLLKMSFDGQVEELPAPQAPREDSNLTPSIAILKGNLYCVWKSMVNHGEVNCVYVPLDNLERSGAPWPVHSLDSRNGAYWKVLPIIINSRTSLTTDGNFLYLGYETPGDQWWERKEKVAVVRPDGNLVMFRLGTQDICEYEAGSHVHCFQNAIYSSSAQGTIYEDALSWQGGYGYYELIRIKQYWPEGVGSQKGVSLGSFNKMKIGPCLVSVWIDDREINLQYHSVDRNVFRLSYDGWPLANTAWPNGFF